MAEYVVVDKEQLESDLGIVADAIREKGGTSEQLAFPNGMKEAVEAIQSGDTSEFGESYWIENLNGRSNGTTLFIGWKSEKVPYFDASNITSCAQMFQNSKITEIPPYDLSNNNNFFATFSGATKLAKVPLLNFQKATRVDSMFNQCFALTSVEVENTSKVGNWNGFVGNCMNLKVVKTLDLSGRNVTGDLFQNSTNIETLLFVPNTIKISISFGGMKYLTAESIQSIIDGLADLTGGTAQTITWHKEVYAKLTDEQKVQISNKNWVSASA